MPIVGSVVKATSNGKSQVRKLITQSIKQQIIFNLADSVCLDIVA